MQTKIKKILSVAVIIAVALFLGLAPAGRQKNASLALAWRDLGARMVAAGVIDADKFEGLYLARGGLSPADKELLYGNDNGDITITAENSGMMLNILWAFGLANKNPILENGPMMTYSGASSPAEALAKAGNFASTGGWTLGKGNAMN